MNRYPSTLSEDTSPVRKERGILRFGEWGNSLLDSGDAALVWNDILPSEEDDPEIVDHLRRYGGL